jgi:hypothetical protein
VKNSWYFHLIVGLDRNSDGFLDAVAYPSRCSDWIVFSAAAPPKLPGARHQAQFPCWLQPITVPRFNLEKVELSHSQGWLTKTVNAPFHAFETLASFYV